MYDIIDDSQFSLMAVAQPPQEEGQFHDHDHLHDDDESLDDEDELDDDDDYLPPPLL